MITSYRLKICSRTIYFSESLKSELFENFYRGTQKLTRTQKKYLLSTYPNMRKKSKNPKIPKNHFFIKWLIVSEMMIYGRKSVLRTSQTCFTSEFDIRVHIYAIFRKSKKIDFLKIFGDPQMKMLADFTKSAKNRPNIMRGGTKHL